MSLSNYLEQAIINHTLRGVAYTYPAGGVWAGILSAVDDDGTYTELAGGNYVRRQVLSTNFSAASLGLSSNTVALTWPAATANWGTARYIGLFDSGAGGNLLYWSALRVAKYVALSSIFTMAAGDIDIGLAGAFSLYTRNGVIDLTLRDQAFASNSNIWVGLGAGADPTTSLSEPVGGYSRVKVTSWTQVGSTISVNSAATFGATSDWGNITHAAFYDAVSGGNMLYALALDPARSIYNGDGLIFSSDTITLRVD